MRYGQNEDLALEKISFKVEAGQRIGICGRIGSGKSAVGMALSRIVEIESG